LENGRTEGNSRRTYVVIGVIVAVILVVFAALVIVDLRQRGGSGSMGEVQTFDKLSRDHTKSSVSYPQSPPVGGAHDPAWQNCGFYTQPVRNENGVHSLEHGAVWITYQQNLAQDQIDKLRNLAQNQTYVLVSPYPDLPSPVVASAWGKQERLKGANDPNLGKFVQKYRQGPQTPEPGALCTGGIGNPG